MSGWSKGGGVPDEEQLKVLIESRSLPEFKEVVDTETGELRMKAVKRKPLPPKISSKAIYEFKKLLSSRWVVLLDLFQIYASTGNLVEGTRLNF